MGPDIFHGSCDREEPCRPAAGAGQRPQSSTQIAVQYPWFSNAFSRGLWRFPIYHESGVTLSFFWKDCTFERSEERRVGKSVDLGGGRMIKKTESRVTRTVICT